MLHPHLWLPHFVTDINENFGVKTCHQEQVIIKHLSFTAFQAA